MNERSPSSPTRQGPDMLHLLYSILVPLQLAAMIATPIMFYTDYLDRHPI